MSPLSNQVSIGPTEPIAHEVGLLSLANATEPKYIGPSSGVTFARLIYAAAPQSQGLSAALRVADNCVQQNGTRNNPAQQASIPEQREMYYFIDAYFERIHPLFPFLDEADFYDLADRCAQNASTRSSRAMSPDVEHTQYGQMPSAFDKAQLFLVLFLGAVLLEFKLTSNFTAESYLATAMEHVAKSQLHDSITGVQTLLLLTICSFYSPNGLNAWYLKSTIIASCIDLGLQRNQSRAKCRSPTQTPVIRH